MKHISASVLLPLAATLTSATYTLVDNYNTTNFFDAFTFFSEPDPTQGYVSYKSAIAANNSALAGYVDPDTVFLGVDDSAKSPENPGRPSVRVQSQKKYTHGLFVADISHMPAAQCGSWPAFWTVGGEWPSNGEIDILEGVNTQNTNKVTLHTSANCKLTSTGSKSSSKLHNTNCNFNTAFTGCGFSTADERNYGDGFNANKGGVYAMEWTSESISVFFFPRGEIPQDIIAGKPDPSSKGWGQPTAMFSGDGCDIDAHFKEHTIVFNTAFCGQWAGSVWEEDAVCGKLANTCDEYVRDHPEKFSDAYWLIESVKVYQDGEDKGKVVVG